MQGQVLEGFKLSPQQKRLWLFQQINSVYFAEITIAIAGNLNADVLKTAVEKVVSCHEILRTRFHRLPGVKTPLQVVETTPKFSWTHVDGCDRTPENIADPQRDLSSNLSCKLIAISEQKHFLQLQLPALCADSASLKILVQQISEFYQALLENQALPDAEEIVQYVQFSEWQNELLSDPESLQGQNYWLQQDFSALSTQKVPLENRHSDQFFQPAIFEQTLKPALLKDLENIAENYQYSLSNLFLAAWKTFLYRLSNQAEIIVGVAFENRQYEELVSTLGLLVEFLPIKVCFSEDIPFSEILQIVKNSVASAGENQEYFNHQFLENSEKNSTALNLVIAGSDATETIPAWIPFQFEFTVLQTYLSGNTNFSVQQQAAITEPFKLKLACQQNSNTLTLAFHYNQSCFTKAVIEAFAEQFQTLLTSITNHPQSTVREFNLLSDRTRHQLLFEFNQTAKTYPSDRCLHELFTTQAEQTPNNIAVVFENQHLTYRELNQRSNQLASVLQQRGVKPDAIVGLCVTRSLDAIIGLLGILKAGGAYLPLDPAFPPASLGDRLADAGVTLLVTQQSLIANLPATNAEILTLDDISITDSAPLNIAVKPHHLAYVIYTSGSTGKAKGVAIEHRQIVHYLHAIADTLNLPEKAHFALVSTLAADLGNTVIFASLCRGGCLHIISQDRATDALAFADYCTEHPIDCLKIVPSHLAALLAASESPHILPRQHLILGGETANWELIEQIQMRSPNCSIFNHYGPTETTVGVLTYPIQNQHPQAATVPLGRPLPNTQIYLLNSHLQPVPMGVPGEIYIQGEGLARGYLNEPELTAEKFISHPLNDSEKIYKTGDLARYLPDGNLEFLGRIDQQVKIRGFRIELGEIEAAIRQSSLVQAAVVETYKNQAAEQTLIAYIVPQETTEKLLAKLRDFLQQKLPDYMIPANFFLLNELPLSLNGKVNRQALPKPEELAQKLDTNKTLPRTPVEEILAGIWANLLNLHQVGIYDNFFELGGHSLLATQAISRLRNTFKIEFSLRSFFESPTIAEIGEKIEAALKGSRLEELPIQPASRNQHLPLSFAQQRLWFLDQLEPNSPAYNLPRAIHISGQLNIFALEQSFNEVIRRHEILRTNVATIDGKPVQKIHAERFFKLITVDLQSLPETEQNVQVKQLIDAAANDCFDLSSSFLISAKLLILNQTNYWLLLTLHHIVSDAWSTGIFIREIASLYPQFAESDRPPSPLPALPIQYADFAIWQQQWLQGENYQNQLSYWQQKLGKNQPILQLPTTYPRPPIQTFNGATQSQQFSAELTTALKQLSHRNGATLFMTLLAAFKTLLYRYTGETNIRVGSPIANRNRREIEGLIGFFVNTLVLQTNLAQDLTFCELLARVRGTTLEAYLHQDVPFEKLVDELQPERNLNYSPLFQVMFVLQNTPTSSLELPGLTLTPEPVNRGTAKFDLTLEIEEQKSGLFVTLEYNTDLFAASAIARMLGHFQTLLEGILTNPETRLTDLPILTAAERHQLLFEFSNHSAKNQVSLSQTACCIHHLFEAQVERTPDAIAVVFQDQSLTYQELNQRANQLAHYLQDQGVQPDTLVGIYIERSLEMLVGLLGILKAGATYVPLDPTHPQERLALILKDAQVPLLLTQEHLKENLPVHQAKVIDLNQQSGEISLQNSENLLTDVSPENLAYVIYTSGSTGQPKGVQIEHHSVVNFLLSMQEQPGLSAKDTLLAVTTITFDIAALELYLPLIVGAKIVLASREVATNGLQLSSTLIDANITVMQATPATWRMLLEAGWQGKKSLKVLCGGEALTANLAQQLLAKNAELWNLYGPTETTIWSTVSQVTYPEDSRYLGRAIANTQLYVLDSSLQPVPIGVPGELYIGGEGLARGYLNKPNLTTERFFPNPFSNQPEARLYKSGDLVRYDLDGNLEFLSRTDYQVKIRGFRIELGEIEATLCQHPDIQNAVVILSETEAKHQQLVAYLVQKSEAVETCDAASLREFLQQKLPNYMMPSGFVFLPQFPLTANGKIDRRSLPAFEAVTQSVEKIPPRNETEQILADIWAEILHLNQVSIDDNFFALGGDSILSIQMIYKAKAAGLNFTPKQLFEHQTIAELASIVEKINDEKLSQSSSDFSFNLNESELNAVLASVNFE